MKEPVNPIRPTDAAARVLARGLLDDARTAALGTLAPDGHPVVTRIAVLALPDGSALTLVSALSAHSRALRADARCSLLVGEPGPRGDPLNSPRLTVRALAEPLDSTGPDRARLRDLWLAAHPKAKLYIDFADFFFVRFRPLGVSLNGGFGKAFELAPADLAG